MVEDVTVRFAAKVDIPALKTLDSWPKELMWERKIAAREVIVLEVAHRIVGLARYAILWTTVPFLGLITIEAGCRGRGFSRRMLEFLKRFLREEGYVALLSSSQTDEPEAQNWHRHMGFTSNGILENIADEGVGEVVYRLRL